MNLANQSVYYAFSMRGIPFLLGGQDSRGIDCSGMIVNLLKRQGYAIEDMTAQGLMDTIFTLSSVADERGTIACAFYGADVDSISHVGLIIDKERQLVIDSSEEVGRVEARVWPYVTTKTYIRFADMSYLIARLRRPDSDGQA